jgi:hypothetical protein
MYRDPDKLDLDITPHKDVASELLALRNSAKIEMTKLLLK